MNMNSSQQWPWEMFFWLIFFAVGYIGLPVLAVRAFRDKGWWTIPALLIAWIGWIAYTFLTIHTSQTYYHPHQ